MANNSLWERCCAALARPELTKDPRFATEADRVQNREVLVPLLNEVLGTRSAEEWIKRFEARRGAGRAHQHGGRGVRERASEGARHDRRRCRIPKAKSLSVMGVPVRLHATPGEPTTPPPLLGQHTESVLRSRARTRQGGRRPAAQGRGALTRWT